MTIVRVFNGFKNIFEFRTLIEPNYNICVRVKTTKSSNYTKSASIC